MLTEEIIDRLAMYYNGYIIICIFIGAFVGAFVFQWEVLGLASVSNEMEWPTLSLTVVHSGTGGTSATEEATVCCG